MSTATNPPRCPHRVANTRRNAWLIVLIASLLGSTPATVSLYGQEISLDYRLVEPAGHMQLWPVDKPEIFIPVAATPRIAAKWRTNLSASRKERTPRDEDKLSDPKQDANNEAEVLVVPKKSAGRQSTTPNKPKTKENPSSRPHQCYQVTPLSALTSSITLPAGKLPTNAAAECAERIAPTSDARLAGAWPATEQHWSATCSRHRPLYFEEINAERYGYTSSYALQPLISAAHFFGTIPALPYKMAIDRPNDCIYTLGHYRPGSCAPRRHSHLPWQPKAVIAEAGVLAGLILLVP